MNNQIALDENKIISNEKNESCIQRKESEKEEWTSVIRPPTGWFDVNLKELWQYRDLVKLFVYRDFVVYYKQTILGPLWWLIQPLFTSGMFTLIFGKIAKIPTDQIPPILFYMSGVIMWSYFSECLIQTSNTFITNSNMFGKVYFPRLVIPVSVVCSGIIKFSIQFSLFLVFYFVLFFKGAPIKASFLIVLLPLLILQMAMMGLGFGIIVSSLTTKYRDLALAVNFFVQLWMYATPVVYPLSLIPAKWRIIYLLNPMTSVVESFRFLMLGVGSVTFFSVMLSISITLFALTAGIIFFSRVEKSFMDTV